MFWMICVQLVVLAGVTSVFLMNWPWRQADKRKLSKYLAEDESCLVEMSGGWWAKWERVGRLAWITAREYSVSYTDKEGRRHQATAKFYLPWWLNKELYDSGLIDNWNLVEIDGPDVQE